MKPINDMKLTFTSRSTNERFARSAVAAFVSQLDPTVEEVNDITTAVSEAVTNAIVHAYPEALGTVTVSVQIYENNRVVIKVRDRGQGIPDVKQAMEPLYTMGGGPDRAGLGFTIMESFTDRLRVHSILGKGTVVTMEKYIARRVKGRP